MVHNYCKDTLVLFHMSIFLNCPKKINYFFLKFSFSFYIKSKATSCFLPLIKINLSFEFKGIKDTELKRFFIGGTN